MLRGRCSWSWELEFVRIKSWTLFQWRAGSARPAPGCVSAQEPSQLPGNFPFPSHNSRLGSCSIPGTPEPVGLQDGNTRHHRTLGWLLLVHSFTIHLIHTWHCSSTGEGGISNTQKNEFPQECSKKEGISHTGLPTRRQSLAWCPRDDALLDQPGFMWSKRPNLRLFLVLLQ